jgi:hypothetical protein
MLVYAVLIKTDKLKISSILERNIQTVMFHARKDKKECRGLASSEEITESFRQGSLQKATVTVTGNCGSMECLCPSQRGAFLYKPAPPPPRRHLFWSSSGGSARRTRTRRKLGALPTCFLDPTSQEPVIPESDFWRQETANTYSG